MADPEVNIVSLFAGVGGLDLGVELALRRMGHAGRVNTVVVEIEAYPLAVSLERGEEGRLPVVAGFTDVVAFDGGPFRGCVDFLLAGFPCQPWSVAGRRAGTDDDRWLWPTVARIARDVQPRWVVLENVPGLLRGGLGPVLADLAALGFDAEWTSLRASDAGAPHRRERVFVVAHARRERDERRGEPGELRAPPGGVADADEAGRVLERGGELLDRERSAQRDDAMRRDGTGDGLAVADRERPQGFASARQARPDDGRAGRGGRTDVEHAGCERMEGRQSQREWHDVVSICSDTERDVQRYADLPCFPPGPNDHAAWRAVLKRWLELAPAVGFASRGYERVRGVGNKQGSGQEQHRGPGRDDEQPAEREAPPQPPVRGVADGLVPGLAGAARWRADALRAGGNGVVPEQAARAVCELMRRLSE